MTLLTKIGIFLIALPHLIGGIILILSIIAMAGLSIAWVVVQLFFYFKERRKKNDQS